jgi:hypothetical protein
MTPTPRTYRPGLEKDLYQQAFLKRELFDGMTVAEAATEYATALGDAMPPTISAVQMEGMFDHLQRTDAHFQILARASPFEIADPLIAGSSQRNHTRCAGRSVFIGQLSNAIVRHRSSFVQTSDRVLLDVQGAELNAIPLLYEFDPAVLAERGGEILTIDRPGKPVHRVAEAIHLGGATSHAFGHWLAEYLPKWLGAIRSGIVPHVPIITDAGMPRSHREALRFFGGELEIIELEPGAVAEVSRLWILGNRAYVPLFPQAGQNLGPEHISFPPEAWAALQRWIWTWKPAPAAPREKLFLARREQLHRKMINRRAVEEIAQTSGFRIVYLEEHDFADQMAMVRNAEAIAGPDGSALLLALYGRPGTRITILSHPFIENLGSLTSILEHMGMDCLLVQGDCVREDTFAVRLSDYTIDTDLFRSALERPNPPVRGQPENSEII